MRKLAFLIVCPLAIAGIVAYASVRGIARPAQAPAQDEISSPEGWVAFDANVVATVPNQPAITGRFFRSSDGSTRLELTRTNDGFSVVNIGTQGALYVFDGKKWMRFKQPGRLNHAPPRVRKSQRGLSQTFQRRGDFDIYTYALPDGNNVYQQARELNFFSVLKQDLITGRREEYSNIVMRDQAAELFQPPAGVEIRDVEVPAGTKPEAPQTKPK